MIFSTLTIKNKKISLTTIPELGEGKQYQLLIEKRVLILYGEIRLLS